MTNKKLTQQEIWKALVDGETIQDIRTKIIYKFIDNKLCFSKRIENIEDYFMRSNQSFRNESEMYEIYKEPSWTDNLPTICWVCDDNDEERYEAIITEYEHRYKSNINEYWTNAEPWTEQDWEKYRAK